MDEKELEALKTSNPTLHAHIVKIQGENNTLKAAAILKDGKGDKDGKDGDKDKDKGKDGDKDKDGKDGGDDLKAKADKERKAAEDRKADFKSMESAIGFNHGVEQFIKDHADILPSEIGEIFAVAGKEKYDSAAEKASALRSAFIQSFFSVQANVDLLTKAQKITLEDYLKLTKNGKEQKAEAIYENLFEPTLEMLKRVKKAEELGKARSGYASGGNKTEDAYRQRLIDGSRKSYLGEKKQGA
jgi:hypothetical protein